MIAYEPIWAIGTGKTASTAQAQEMHAHIRSVLKNQYGDPVAMRISILYGGSVKANNARKLFASKDVDGGLVGGASLDAAEFIEIIKALKIILKKNTELITPPHALAGFVFFFRSSDQYRDCPVFCCGKKRADFLYSQQSLIHTFAG